MPTARDPRDPTVTRPPQTFKARWARTRSGEWVAVIWRSPVCPPPFIGDTVHVFTRLNKKTTLTVRDVCRTPEPGGFIVR